MLSQIRVFSLRMVATHYLREQQQSRELTLRLLATVNPGEPGGIAPS
jgi:hypothetical protein